MQGQHLTADCYGCTCAKVLLVDVGMLSDACRGLVTQSGLTVVAETWHQFPGSPGGVTGVLLLAESHVAIHTWPEMAGVTLDVHVCNFSADNSAKADGLMQAFLALLRPAESQLNRLVRGSMAPRVNFI